MEYLDIMLYGYIYRAKNIINNKIYIGQTINFTLRKRKHITDAKSGCGSYYFHNAINKYGEDNFQWEILEKIQSNSMKELKKLLCSKEKWYIKLYNSMEEGYNLTEGGENPPVISNLPNSKEIYKRIGEKSSERMKGKGNPCYGKKHSEEHKNKISKALKGRVFSDEYRKKLSDNTKGKTWEERYGNEIAERMKLLKSESALKQSNHFSKLTKENVIFIRENQGNYSKKELAKMFNIHYSTVWKIITFKVWKNI